MTTPTDDSHSKTLEVHARLNAEHGFLPWRGHGDPVDELVGTILSQHTSDTNTARAFAALKRAYPTWDQVVSAPTAEVAETIRSGGLANIKAPRIQNVLRALLEQRGSFSLGDLTAQSVADARAELTSLPGVGPKTASCVLLFSLGMPAMPVDTHVHRVSQRVGLIPPTASAEAAHGLLEARLPANRDDMYGFHMHLIRHGRTVCAARRPACERCVLSELCDDFQSRNSADV